MKRVERCRRLGKAVFEKECLLNQDRFKENEDCQECPFNPKKPVKPKISGTSLKPLNPKIANQVSWRAEAVDIPSNPFKEEQYRAIERVMEPINGFDLRSKLKDAAIWYLAFIKESEGRPRLSKIRKNLAKVEKMATSLSDLLHNKLDDHTLSLLGDIWEKIYNYEDDVHKISIRAWSELKTFPKDNGGPRPWQTAGQKAYFQTIAKIYEDGTGKSIKRVFNPETGKPSEEYKRVLDFFRLCWEFLNPADKKLSDSALDSKLKYYVLDPAKK